MTNCVRSIRSATVRSTPSWTVHSAEFASTSPTSVIRLERGPDTTCHWLEPAYRSKEERNHKKHNRHKGEEKSSVSFVPLVPFVVPSFLIHLQLANKNPRFLKKSEGAVVQWIFRVVND